MLLTLSSKGQVVLPAPMRRRLQLKPRAKLEIEERDGGLFLRPATPARAIPPIDYPPPGSLRLNQRLLELDRLAGPDLGPNEP